MVISVETYSDFKSLGLSLTGAVIYTFTSDPYWFAWAIHLTNGVGVSISLSTGEPQTFATDFPSRTTLAAPLNLE